MINRDTILSKAMHECMVEMYKWSQPSINLEELIENGYTDNKEHPLYSKHYLSSENFNYLKSVYANAYGITDYWDDTFELIYNQLEKGGVEENYILGKNGFPGYKDYKNVDPLKMHLHIPEDFKVVIEYIKKIQNFFKGHKRELDHFNMTICLGPSPSSNKETVEAYWKTNERPNFKIKDFKIDDIVYGGLNDEYIDITEEEFINTLK